MARMGEQRYLVKKIWEARSMVNNKREKPERKRNNTVEIVLEKKGNDLNS